jgi:polyhydroxyalkanoate synthesis regulator phasin
MKNAHPLFSLGEIKSMVDKGELSAGEKTELLETIEMNVQIATEELESGRN